MYKPRELFELAENFDEDVNGGIGVGVHDNSSHNAEESYRVYHIDGYCFDIQREYQCDPDEIEDYNDIEWLEDDGYTYSFTSEYDNFKSLDIDKAIELMKQ